MPLRTFSFGTNWLSYSSRALDENKIARARSAFRSLTDGIELRGARFLDIGFGQGLGLFLAAEAGAVVLGIDPDPLCAQAVARTGRFFSAQPRPTSELVSILDDDFVRREKVGGGFDVVHSWGVLHHTGDMNKALRNAGELVKPGGFLIISIYNRHWSSPWWRGIKYLFNRFPPFLQGAAIYASYPLFYLRALFLGQGEGSSSSRGMDLEHDIRDWLGGYPYEYASPAEIETMALSQGFKTVRCVAAKGYTGCNEFVFEKVAPASRAPA